MFDELQQINTRPDPFSRYTADALWTDLHISERMLAFHLDGTVDVSSRTEAFIVESTRWITNRFAIGEGTRVADLGCGPGLYANRLAQTGASLTGVDFSERSIRHARAAAEDQGVQVTYVQADYRQIEIDETFDLVLLIMCDYCALAPELRSQLLGDVAALLRPGGSFLFDVYSSVAFEGRREAATYSPNLMDGFWSPRPYFGFLNTFKYDREKVTLDKYEILERDRSATYFNWLQHFEPPMLTSELEQAGLRVQELFGDVAGSTYDLGAAEFAVVAQRRP